ncbi:MAG: hypothetical protein HY279_14490 [Nitrospinae bacterium]|nr:hypothetical protein [Nitrospinota bacterium]
MRKEIFGILCITIFCFLSVSKAWAVGCNSGQGKITLDASKSSIQGGGTVWSNSQLDHGQSASKSTHVSLKGDPTTITNQAGSDGYLVETSTGSPNEFTASKNTYTGMEVPGYDGGQKPLNYFDQSEQLFNFDRYNAAASATGNSLTWSEFVTRVQNNEPLYGIVSITADFNNGSSDLSLDTGSINIKGTLVVNVINNPNNKKLKVGVPINVNPVTSPTTGTTTLTSTDFDTWTTAAANRTSASDPSPWPSGYGSAWDEVKTYNSGAKDPRGRSIGAYTPFGQNEDLPALMYTGGIVDIHHAANISGVVYTPNFVEIEQKQGIGEVQYINGAVVAGAGIFIESNNCGGGIGVVYDPDVLDNLNVTPSIGALKRLAWKRLK